MSLQTSEMGISVLEPIYVVLTPYAISLFPKMLAVINPSYKLIVPRSYYESALFDYLSNFQKPAKLRLLFQKALEANIVEIKDVAEEKRISTDDLVITLARNLAEENKSVIVVAAVDDIRWLRKRIDRLSILNSIEIIDIQEFRLLLNASDSTINSELLELVKGFQLERQRLPIMGKWWPLSELLIPLAVMLFGLLKPKSALSFLFQINTWIAISLVAAFSIFLFWYRAKYRLYYGILEVIFGLAVSSSVFFSNVNYSQLLAIDYVKLVSGIYIVIRGLDNIETGLPYTDSEIVKHYWQKLFKPPEPRI